jgi:putative CocE/NonD family hydrolase
MASGSEPRYDVRLLHDCRVPTRDGVTLSADVYLPRARGPFPTVYQWTPYESTRDRFIAWGVWFARRGYAAVVQDVRGRYESEGEFYPYVREGEDAYDSLDWATGRAWCNGRIGTW